MDTTHELRRAKFALLALLVFCVASVKSCGELKYALSGKTTQATLVGVKEMRQAGRRRSTRILEVEYRFQDGELSRREMDEVPVDWPLQRGETVAVQYRPGVPEASRLKGHDEMLWVGILAASFGALAFFAFRFWRFYKS